MGKNLLLALMGFTILAISFQNCSIAKYESSSFGMSKEQQINALSESLRTSQEFSKVANDTCLQYIPQTSINEVFASQDIQTKAFIDSELNQLNCIFTEIEKSQMIHCKISGSISDKVNFPDNHLIPIDSNIKNRKLLTEDINNQHCILGKDKYTINGVECCYDENQDLEQQNYRIHTIIMDNLKE